MRRWVHVVGHYVALALQDNKQGFDCLAVACYTAHSKNVGDVKAKGAARARAWFLPRPTFYQHGDYNRAAPEQA